MHKQMRGFAILERRLGGRQSYNTGKSINFPLAKLLKKLFAAVSALLPMVCYGAELNGAELSLAWSLPFAGLLLSIALAPLWLPGLWERHFGKIAGFWALAYLMPCALTFGTLNALGGAAHAFIAEYFPFLILLAALFTVAGGICVKGNLHGTPRLNTGLLALGTVLASCMGTTGAAILLIRPLIRANDNRRRAAHVVIFFIFLVANAGGVLTPLGDPPLFLGFLQGVDFFWTLKNLLPEAAFVCISLLVIFYFLDRYYYSREEANSSVSDPTPDAPLYCLGKINFVLLLVIVALVLMSGVWRPNVSMTVFGTEIALQNLVRDIALISVILLSLWLTPQEARSGNEFSWGPMQEVAKIFAAIFITIIPVTAMLKAGTAGAFSSIIHAVTDASGKPVNVMYFWASGALSSFLDNAPTYLVFFNTAGGDAQVLMTNLGPTLAAISCGAVFMGANSYIGNAPNMMVKAIAEHHGVKMPSFFAYMGWSAVVLLPLFLIMSVLFFR